MQGTGPAAPGREEDGSGPAVTGAGAWRRSLEVILGVLGGIALFLGVFVHFAGEDQSIGFFGVWSVRAVDVSDTWKFALLAGGSLLLGLSFGLVALRRSHAGTGSPGATIAFTILGALGFVGAAIFGLLWAL